MGDTPAGFVKVHNPKVPGAYLLVGERDPILANYTRFEEPAPKDSKAQHGGKASLGTTAAPVVETPGPSESLTAAGAGTGKVIPVPASAEAAFVEEEPAAPKVKASRNNLKPYDRPKARAAATKKR